MKINLLGFKENRHEHSQKKTSFKRKGLFFSYLYLFFVAVFVFFLISVILSFKLSNLLETLVVLIILFLIFTAVAAPVYLHFKYENFLHDDRKNFFKMLADDNKGIYFEDTDLDKIRNKWLPFLNNKKIFIDKGFFFQKSDGVIAKLFSYHFISDEKDTDLGGVIYSENISNKVPNMYLDYKHNLKFMKNGSKIPSSTEFEKYFDIVAPDSYHLEALQVFSPDVLNAILDLPTKIDVEIIDGEILCFLNNHGFSMQGEDLMLRDAVLDKEIKNAQKIVSLVRDNAEKIRWSPVGDKSYHL